MTDARRAHVVANPRLGTLGLRGGRRAASAVRVGKVELGQGILTALAQIAADALALPLTRSGWSPPHTAHGPDEGLTAGSLSVLQTGPALRHVGGVVRALAGPTVARVDEYVARIAALDPDTDLHDGRAPSDAGRAPVGRRPQRAAARPARQGARPAPLPRRPAAPGPAARPGAAAAVARCAPAGRRRADSARHRGVDAGARRLVPRRGRRARGRRRPGARAARRATPGGTSATCCPTRTTWPPGCAPGPHEEMPVLDEASAAGAGPASSGDVLPSRSWPTPRSRRARRRAVGPTTGVHVWSAQPGHPRAARRASPRPSASPPTTVVVEHVENAGCYGHNAADDAAFDAVAARPRGARSAGAGALDPPRRAGLGTALPGDDGDLAATGWTDGRITGWTPRRLEPGAQLAARLRRHARPAGRRPPRGADAAAARRRPAPGRRRRDDPQRAPGYDVGPRRVAGHRKLDSPLRTSAMRALGALPQRLRDRVASSTSWPRPPAPTRWSSGSTTSTTRAARRVLETAAPARRLGRRRLPEDVGRGLGLRPLQGPRRLLRGRRRGRAVHREVRVRRLDGRRRRRPGGQPRRRPQPARGRRDAGHAAGRCKERVRFDRRRMLERPTGRPTRSCASPRPPVVDVHLVERRRPRRSGPARPPRARPRPRSPTPSTRPSASASATSP